MIDPMVSLAFAVYSNKGAYALLLGSGISRPSRIPTGWEIVNNLIMRVAVVAEETENCKPDPAEWFRQKYGEKPDYSKLLDDIAKTPAERQQLLRGYFEPTEEERADGLKRPSAAHKAIAQLVAAGYLRVIITTNFDRLMEMALEEESVTPTVISTTDQLKGAWPLAHSGPTLIKLHGDYRDTRIKNTEKELATYDRAWKKLLNQVLDEYGLIVSGWSGDWDMALRAAIERCPSRRFTTFWGTLSPLSGESKALADHRRAVILETPGADQLFVSLREKVLALADMAAPHPLSAKMAAATVKRYLLDPMAKIRLHDLVHEETERLYREISGAAFERQMQNESPPKLTDRLEKYGVRCEIVLSIFVTGCYWGKSGVTDLWVKSLQRIADLAECEDDEDNFRKMRRYSVLLLLYGAGIAALAKGNYETLAAILTEPKVKDEVKRKQAICSVVHLSAVDESVEWGKLTAFDRRLTPVSDHLFVKLREPLREYLPREEDYQNAFDCFECLFALVHADLNRIVECGGWWGPVYRFAGKMRNQTSGISKKIDEEIEKEGVDWMPLKAGLFGGLPERAKKAKEQYDAFLANL